MFEQTFVTAAPAPGRAWSTLCSTAAQATVITLLAIGSMARLDPLPRTSLQMLLAAPAPPPAPAPLAPANAPGAAAHAPVLSEIHGKTLVLPAHVPAKLEWIDDGEAAAFTAGYDDGVPGSLQPQAGEIFRHFAPALAPPAAPVEVQPEKPREIARMRLGGNVEEALRIYAPPPVYPALAMQARVGGVVRLAAIIARDGTVRSLTVVSGHPLLAPAAVAAVRNWRYRPTKLNGDAVEVLTTIEVHFRLGQ